MIICIDHVSYCFSSAPHLLIFWGYLQKSCSILINQLQTDDPCRVKYVVTRP